MFIYAPSLTGVSSDQTLKGFRHILQRADQTSKRIHAARPAKMVQWGNFPSIDVGTHAADTQIKAL
jgi:hypothetical protein